MIRLFQIVLFPYIARLFPPVFADVPHSEYPLDFIPVYHYEKNYNNRNSNEKEKTSVLVVTYIIASESKKDCAEEPSRATDHKKF